MRAVHFQGPGPRIAGSAANFTAGRPADLPAKSPLRRFTQKNIDYIPIVEPDHKSHVLGMLSRHDVIAAYHDKVTELQHTDEELTRHPE
jgi:CBS-domain-containing membrane protein